MTGLNVYLEGGYAGSNDYVWTGREDGTDSCSNWSTTSGDGRASVPTTGSSWLTGSRSEPCTDTYSVYCLED